MEAKHESTALSIEIIKKSNPELKKIHKFHNNPSFFNTKFELFSLDPTISSSYLFDESDCAYELGKALGKGAFGLVKTGVMVQSGKKVAIKIQTITSQIEYHRKTIGDLVRARSYVLEQIEIEDALLKLTGQFITSLRRTTLKNQEKHYSVMEYIEGGLLKKSFPTLCMEKKIQCFIEITQQMVFLHDHDYLHLDIWRENILFNGHAKLHDYGCAAKLVDGTYLSKLKGSHIPPEIINSHLKQEVCIYSKSSDIYALGMTFYELLYGDYYDYSLDSTLYEFIERYSDYYRGVVAKLAFENAPLAQLINTMISPRLEDRPNSQAILCFLSEKLSSELVQENPIVSFFP